MLRRSPRFALPLVPLPFVALPLLALLALCLPHLAPPLAADGPSDAAAKDQRIRELEAEVTRLKAEVARLEGALAAAQGRPPAPPPTSSGIHQGQETSREQLKFLHYSAKAYRRAPGEAAWPALDGKNFVLWLVAVGMLEKDNEGSLKMLFSPADKALAFPGVGAYAAVSLTSLATQRFPRLTSYAGRRNADPTLALRADSPPASSALFADLSFGDGALVAFLDGKVRYLNRAELGLAPTDPLVAGPASKSPVLRTLSSE